MFMLSSLFLCCFFFIFNMCFVSLVDTLCIYSTYYFCFCQSFFLFFLTACWLFTVFGIFLFYLISYLIKCPFAKLYAEIRSCINTIRNKIIVLLTCFWNVLSKRSIKTRIEISNLILYNKDRAWGLLVFNIIFHHQS